jgi:hypothetical protein
MRCEDTQRDGPARSDSQPSRGPRARRIARLAAALVAVASAGGCGAEQERDPRDDLCARVVRFHRGLVHPVQVTASDRSPGSQNVRIAYRGTRQESSIEGTALCREGDETGELRLHGGSVDDKRLEPRQVDAFNRFVASRKRVGG